jgi:thymidine kinase
MDKQCGHLTILMGCMFAQKTTELLRRIRRYKSIGYNVLIVNYQADQRYGQNRVASHDGEFNEALTISYMSEVDNLISQQKYNVLVIDEAQFFPDLFQYVTKWLDSQKIHIVIAGLDGDSERRPFGDILRLVPHAEHVERLTALCSVCRNGTLAQFTKYLKDSANKKENEVNIGAQEAYIPVCRRHFLATTVPPPVPPHP